LAAIVAAGLASQELGLSYEQNLCVSTAKWLDVAPRDVKLEDVCSKNTNDPKAYKVRPLSSGKSCLPDPASAA